MKAEEQQRYFELGKHYWWLAGKYQIVGSLLNSLSLRLNARILDFGCGPGNVLDLLSEYGKVVGTDTSLEALRFCWSRGYDGLFQGKGDSLALKDGIFELVVAVDVLEHIKDDLAAMREIYRICLPSGFLVVTVPAFKFLWGEHDRKYGHKRRYTARMLRSKLEEVGFSVTKISYIHPAFALPLWLWRKWKRVLRSEEDDFIATPRWLNQMLKFTISIEGSIVRIINLPFGSSIICIARK